MVSDLGEAAGNQEAAGEDSGDTGSARHMHVERDNMARVGRQVAGHLAVVRRTRSVRTGMARGDEESHVETVLAVEGSQSEEQVQWMTMPPHSFGGQVKGHARSWRSRKHSPLLSPFLPSLSLPPQDLVTNPWVGPLRQEVQEVEVRAHSTLADVPDA